MTQLYDDSSVEVSLSFMVNSTILNSVTIYCFERVCFTNSNIGDLYSITPLEDIDIYSFAEEISVIEPGLYSCIIFTHMLDFEIGIH